MHKDIWKQMLYKISDRQLCQLVGKIGLSLPGFRRLDEKQTARMRHVMIAECMKPRFFHQVKKEFQRLCKEADPPELYMTREEIMEKKDDAAFLAAVIPILISSGEADKEQLAEELCLLQQPESAVAGQKENIQVKEQKRIILQLEEKVKRQQEKLTVYQAQSAEAQKKQKQYERELKRNEQQTHTVKKQLFTIKQEYEEQTVRYEEQQAAYEQLKREVEKLLRNAAEQERQAILQQEEIDRLRMLCLSLSEAGQETAAAIPADLQTVAIIGDIPQDLLPDTRCNVFSLDRLGEALQRSSLSFYQYVCILRFSMTPSGMRKARQVIQPHQLKEFQDIRELLQFLQREGFA